MSQNLSHADASVEVPPLNSQQNQIQALVGDIDEILSKPSPRLPWMASVETVHQRQVLERIRNYLSTQQAPEVVATESLQQSDVDREAGSVGDRSPRSTASTDSGDRQAAQEILQAVMGEMSYLRTNLTQSLQDDIKALRQEQQTLISEIKQLERQRQEHTSLAQQQANQQQIISEFLQVLMGRLQENLAREVAQALGNLEAQFLHNNLLEVGDRPSAPQLTSGATAEEANLTSAGQLPLLTPAQRLEQIRLLQGQSDRALMRLDSTLSVVFEALQSNLQTYQESLSQGLEKMHSLGQQGEAMFAALVSHLASQLGREASSYVQSSIPVANIETPTRKADPTPPPSTLPQNEAAVQEITGRQGQERSPESESDLDDIGEEEKLPYPGTELSPQFTQLRHDREEFRNLGTQEHPPTVPEDDFFSVESPIAEPPSEAMIAEDDVEDLYDSLFTPEIEISSRAEESVGRRGKVNTLSLFKSPAVETTNVAPTPIPEPKVTEMDTDDGVEDFLLESDNFTSEPKVTEMDTDDGVEDFLLESDNFISEPTVAEMGTDDGVEDFLLESDNFTSEPKVTEMGTDDGVEDFLLESDNFISEPKVTEMGTDDGVEDFLISDDSEFTVANSVDSQGIETAGFAYPDEDLFTENETQLEWQEPTPTAPPQSERRDSSETVAALSDVFEDEAPQMSAANTVPAKAIRQSEPPSPAAITELDPIADWNADIYIQASPDENLLPVETPEEEPEQALLLNANALQQLQADLFSLEGMDSPNRSQSSSDDVSEQFGFSDFSELEAENPFIVSAEEEMTSLDDLFAEVLEMPVAAAPEPSQEVAAEQFSSGDASGMTLEDILASLMEAEATSLNYPPRADINSPPLATSGQVTRSLETPDREKKKVGLFESEEEFVLIPEENEESFSVSVPTLFAPPTGTLSHSPTEPRSNWYLGIDFGTAMLKAALVNRESGDVYPIYWEVEGKNRESECFGIPAVVCLSVEGNVKLVGDPELPLEKGTFGVQNFKRYLKVGVPYISSHAGDLFEPMLQWSEQQAVSLGWLLHGLRSLLALLNPAAVENSLSVRSRALGLEPSISCAVLRELGGVILNSPAGWPDAYRHNLREAVLGAGLVTDSSHIFVVEDAIATLLSELTPNLAASTSKTQNLTSKISSGGTLIVNSGAATTELALVDLPENPENLTYSHFNCHSFAYGGNALDQDIICQLLLQDESFGLLNHLPRAGYADEAARSQLQQRLQSQPLGQALLAAAANLKVILQQQDRFNLEIGDRRWDVKRRDLESKVLVPFVQQLNREVNTMLSRVGMSPVGINQAICTGGNASWPAIARWLRQKLPNAIVISDRDANLPPLSPSSKSKTSRVACGLATLALYPQILDAPRQQYSDYFLIWELMLAFGSKTLSLNEIMQALERRGINTRACQSRIITILNGQLPAGLLPSQEDKLLLTEESRGNPELAIIGATPLFNRGGDGEYGLNQEQAKYLREYISRLMASSQQKLDEPLFQSLVGNLI